MRRRSTPGLLGYLLAVVVAVLVTATGFVTWQVVAQLPDQSLWAQAGDVVIGEVFCLVYVSVLAVPTAVVGVPLVHLLTRRIDQQPVHVLVAGLAGAVAGAGWAAVADGIDGVTHVWWLVPLVALACGVGRAAVIPLVPRVPVEDDSRAGVPAC